MIKETAAGTIDVKLKAKSPARGDTMMYLGILADGRYAVTSKFQYELQSKNFDRALRKFKELCSVIETNHQGEKL